MREREKQGKGKREVGKGTYTETLWSPPRRDHRENYISHKAVLRPPGTQGTQCVRLQERGSEGASLCM